MVRHAGIGILLSLLSGSLIVGCAATKPRADPFLQQSANTNQAVAPSATATAAPIDTSVRVAAFAQAAPSTPMLEAVPHPPAEPTAALHQPLQIPRDLPGSQAPPIRLPAVNPGQPQPDRLAEIERLFRALPELPATMQPVEGAAPLSLAELQDMALRQNPAGSSGDGRRASGPRSRDPSRRITQSER